MPTYQLAIEIDMQGLQSFGAGWYVTIVKSVSGGTPAAWVSFSPSVTNAVTWTEPYSIYASTTQIQRGAKIHTALIQPAVGGNVYPFVNRQFGNAMVDLPATECGVRNGDPDVQISGVPMITSGLYQGAVVNGQSTESPLHAVAVKYGEVARFTPSDKVQVFTSRYPSGVVIGQVPAEACLVDLTDQLSQTIHYNNALNQFLAGPL